ncbi:hypothetical protein HPB50_013398 [Hyalomma asiaticum]|uniref:Uncharacterized protein n=1 Tax=Hyalomma asiaticum TaxID=266040 RepID=A0ACB7RJ01_HYAAI|nr:hypothetical protein HPB50_013398 [Hyalomma asiaticum]
MAALQQPAAASPPAPTSQETGISYAQAAKKPRGARKPPGHPGYQRACPKHHHGQELADMRLLLRALRYSRISRSEDEFYYPGAVEVEKGPRGLHNFVTSGWVREPWVKKVAAYTVIVVTHPVGRPPTTANATVSVVVAVTAPAASAVGHGYPTKTTQKARLHANTARFSSTFS